MAILLVSLGLGYEHTHGMGNNKVFQSERLVRIEERAFKNSLVYFATKISFIL